MLEQIHVEQAQEALLTIRRRVEQYAWLRHALYTRDVSQDRHFRRVFLSQFKLRDKDREFLRCAFAWLEEHKHREVSFEEALLALYRETGLLDPAAASKLASAIDPTLPVWDTQILYALGVRPMDGQRAQRRVERTIEAYEKLCGFYDRYLSSKDGQTAVAVFDRVYPDTDFSDLKKADFTIWSVLWS